MSPRKGATFYSSQCEFELEKYTSKKSLYNALQKSTKNFGQQTKRKKSSFMKKEIKKSKILPDLLFSYESWQSNKT